MRLLEILNKSQQKEFDNPPKFDYAQRKFFFSMPQWATAAVKLIINPVNQVGFVIQVGYFKASGRFFKTKSFNKADLEFVIRRLNLSMDSKDIEPYAFNTIYRHRQ